MSSGRYVKYTLTPAGSDAARAVLGWSREYLAEVARCGVSSIRRFEDEMIDPRRSLVAGDLQAAYEKAGITFMPHGLQWPAEWDDPDREEQEDDKP